MMPTPQETYRSTILAYSTEGPRDPWSEQSATQELYDTVEELTYDRDQWKEEAVRVSKLNSDLEEERDKLDAECDKLQERVSELEGAVA